MITLQSENSLKPPSDFAALLKFFRLHATGIILVTVAATLIGILIALSLPSVYRATVTILIEPRAQRVVQVQEVYDPTQGNSSGEYFATQLELLRSRDIASRVVEKLKLYDDDQFLNDTANESLTNSLKKKLDWQQWLPGLPEPEPAVVNTPEQRREKATAILLGQIAIQPVPKTRLMRVHFFSSNAELAQ